MDNKTKVTKKKKRALLVVGEHNTLTGKQLQDMGKYVTRDGFLIAGTQKYDVFLPEGTIQWIITLKTKG